MKKKLLSLAILAALLVLSPLALAQDNQAKLKQALTWLNKVQSGFSPSVRADVPAIQAILTRYFTEPDTLRASEEEVAVAFLKTMPDENETGTRGANLDKMQEFEALMGSKPATKTKVHTPPVHHRPVPGVQTKPLFSASRVQAPGGKSIGAVNLGINGHSKTVVEVVTSSGQFDVYKRAQIVARRMQKLSSAKPLWWTMLRPAQVRGEYVVAVGNSSDFVITADAAFAKEWGLSSQALAKQLVLKIRSAVDSEKSETFGGRDLTPDDLHLAAVELRQQGDALYKSSPGQAKAKYKQATETDPTYSIPYLRLADLSLTKKDPASARAILDKALTVDGMSADQKSDVQRKRNSIGG